MSIEIEVGLENATKAPRITEEELRLEETPKGLANPKVRRLLFAGGTAVLAQIADLIIAEAQELKAGNAGEICDIQQLACAAEMIWCWRTGEEAVASGSVQPATALMQSAAEDVEKGPSAAKRLIARRAKELGVSEAQAEASFIKQFPIGRLVEPKDIAPMVLFLASQHASAITGQSISIDGGSIPGISY